MGANNGPMALPIQIVSGHLVAVVAQSASQRTEPSYLAQTLRAEWKRVPSGSSEDFLQVSCQPEDHGFVTIYQRYFLRHRKWRVMVRRRTGFWESEGDFPNRKLFP